MDGWLNRDINVFICWNDYLFLLLLLKIHYTWRGPNQSCLTENAIQKTAPSQSKWKWRQRTYTQAEMDSEELGISATICGTQTFSDHTECRLLQQLLMWLQLGYCIKQDRTVLFNLKTDWCCFGHVTCNYGLVF